MGGIGSNSSGKVQSGVLYNAVGNSRTIPVAGQNPAVLGPSKAAGRNGIIDRTAQSGTSNNSEQVIRDAQSKINSLGSRAKQSITVTRPSDNNELRITTERVYNRDYSGRRYGPATYTFRIDNLTTGEREYYTYGNSMGQMKDTVRRIVDVPRRRSRR